MFAGDFRQSDFKYDDERQGIVDFMRVINKVRDFSNIEFNEDDIVRSQLVKDYIISKLKHGIYS